MLPSLMRWRCKVKGLVLAIVVTGCAMAPPVDREAARYEREDARLRAIERFEVLKQACRASGGTVYMDRSWGARFRPTLSDLRTARCAVPLSHTRQ
jgi:hypothetical protein